MIDEITLLGINKLLARGSEVLVIKIFGNYFI